MNKTELLQAFAEICLKAPKYEIKITNGDVIMAMFPDADYEIGKQFVHITNINSIGELSIPLDWWNAPYKAGRTK